MSRSSLTIAVYMAAMFVTGALVGAFGYRLYTANTVYSAPARRSPEEFRKAYVSEMRSRLRLDEKQVTQLNSILDDTRERMRAFRESHRPEFEQIHQDQVSRVSAMLTPSQKTEYDRFRAEREKQKHEEKR